MVQKFLLSPPVAFMIMLFASACLFWLCSRFALRKREKSPGTRKAYACGEDFRDHLIQPDYSQFFPFAFFFTILHVVALVIATVPVENVETFAMAAVYMIGATVGLTVLLRK